MLADMRGGADRVQSPPRGLPSQRNAKRRACRHPSVSAGSGGRVAADLPAARSRICTTGRARRLTAWIAGLN